MLFVPNSDRCRCLRASGPHHLPTRRWRHVATRLAGHRRPSERWISETHDKKGFLEGPGRVECDAEAWNRRVGVDIAAAEDSAAGDIRVVGARDEHMPAWVEVLGAPGNGLLVGMGVDVREDVGVESIGSIRHPGVGGGGRKGGWTWWLLGSRECLAEDWPARASYHTMVPRTSHSVESLIRGEKVSSIQGLSARAPPI